jgi:hypothetical protein
MTAVPPQSDRGRIHFQTLICVYQISRDESDGWEVEEDRVVYFFAEQTRKEDELDNAALVECPPVACVEEWIELAGESLNDVAKIPKPKINPLPEQT